MTFSNFFPPIPFFKRHHISLQVDEKMSRHLCDEVQQLNDNNNLANFKVIINAELFMLN